MKTLQSPHATVFDIGTLTCQHAAEFIQTEPAAFYAEMHWELGYWSGLNASQSAAVGASADKFIIVSEVQKECNLSPSDALYQAETRVYERFKSSGR